MTDRERREAIDEATAITPSRGYDGLPAILNLLDHMSAATDAPFAQRWRWAASLAVLIDEESATFEQEPFGRALRHVITLFRDPK
jgi:hypothetical protein